MPSIASHFVVAKLVYKKINDSGQKIDKEEFYKGNILPDIIKMNNSHYKIKGKYYLIPDIKEYRKNVDINKDINIGYLCHLLLDKYFLEEYVIENIENYDKIQLFSSKMMYNDYTNMNALLVKKYNLDLAFINKIMKKYKEELNENKYKLNIDSINDKTIGKLQFIDFDKFCSFLEDTSKKIYNILKEVK